MALQIILADNQAIFRTGTARVLSMEGDLRLATQCSDAEHLKDAIANFPRSIVIYPSSITTDMHALIDCIERAEGRSVIILEHGSSLDDAITKRVEGVVLRSVSGQQLVECIHRVAVGERSVQRANVTQMPAPDRVGIKVLERLTPKELQIVALVAEGCKNKEIAERLGTKEQVVKNYLRTVYDKTGVSDRLELALFTIHHRVLAEAAERVRAALVKTA